MRQGQVRKETMAKPRRRLSLENTEKLVRMLSGAIEPVATLIDAISRLRCRTNRCVAPCPSVRRTGRQGATYMWPTLSKASLAFQH